MSDATRVDTLSREEEVLAWSAVGVLLVAVGYVVGAILAS